jgi:hypothetical protein
MILLVFLYVVFSFLDAVDTEFEAEIEAEMRSNDSDFY